MLDDDVVVLLVVLDFELVQELVSRFADDHGGEELAPEPGAATGADGLFNDGDVDVGILGELIGAGKTSGTGANDDNIGVGVGDHVRHVTPGHFAGDYGFFNGLEFEVVQIVRSGGGHGDGEALRSRFDGLDGAW